MLKRKSKKWNLAVLLTVAMAASGGGTHALADDLSIPGWNRIPAGPEKPLAENFPVPGVSFPTRLYANHASAYRNKTVALELVQTLPIAVRNSEGHMKSPVAEPYNIKANQYIVTLPGATEVQELQPEPVREWRRHASGIVQLSDPQNEAALSMVPVATSEVATVTYRQQIAPVPTVPKVPSLPAQDDTSAELSTCLTGVQLTNSVRFDSELPGAVNDAKLRMEVAGTQHHWKSGTWVSFRPPRNTFPFEHNPLYFEDPNLERCGRTCGCFTDATSIIKFAGRVPVLPYMMTVESPCSTVRSKGDCPTGCSYGLDGYFAKPEELDLGAAAVQAGMTVGLIFLIP